MIAFKNIFYIIGILLSIITGAMLIPILSEVLFFSGKSTQGFISSMFLTGFTGISLVLANKPNGKVDLKVREAFLLTLLSWVSICFFASLPFYLTKPHLSFLDALFESTSALTTTGASVFTRYDKIPKGIFLWRALLQWLGGVGIIVMAMTLLPILKIGGMQLFRSEFSDRSEKILPKVTQIANAIMITYVALTFLCWFCLKLSGMATFDSTCHALSTLSTGGLSTYKDSISHFKSPAVEWTLSFFMILGGSTLLIFVKLWHKDIKGVLADTQIRFYLLMILAASLFISGWRFFNHPYDFFDILRKSFFMVVSFVTTTGFTLTDYDKWGGFSSIVFFMLSFIGGCTGSTSGGIKIFRFQVLFEIVKSHLRQLRRPHGVYIPLYQGQKIETPVAISVFTFFSLYGLVYLLLCVLLGLSGLDMLSALSGASASLGNVGIGFGHLEINGSVFDLSSGAKITMMAGMILGRLELLGVLVLLIPSFWRD